MLRYVAVPSLETVPLNGKYKDDLFDSLCVQVIKMLMVVVVMFTLAWLPLQLYNVLDKMFPDIN
jgi:hypothetical protein